MPPQGEARGPGAPIGLSPRERRVIRALAAAWDLFVPLADHHPDDMAEFRHAIHAAQCVIAARVAKRADPEEWC